MERREKKVSQLSIFAKSECCQDKGIPLEISTRTVYCLLDIFTRCYLLFSWHLKSSMYGIFQLKATLMMVNTRMNFYKEPGFYQINQLAITYMFVFKSQDIYFKQRGEHVFWFLIRHFPMLKSYLTLILIYTIKRLIMP